jgi:hypothetical protein
MYEGGRPKTLRSVEIFIGHGGKRSCVEKNESLQARTKTYVLRWEQYYLLDGFYIMHIGSGILEISFDSHAELLLLFFSTLVLSSLGLRNY